MSDTVSVLTWIANNPGSTDVEISLNTGCSIQFIGVLINRVQVYGRTMGKGQKMGYYITNIGLDLVDRA